MISADIYLDSLQHTISELPNILNIWEQLDDNLINEYIDQFKWLLNARFIFLSQTDYLVFYLDKILNFTHNLLFFKEKLYETMKITEYDIILKK